MRKLLRAGTVVLLVAGFVTVSVEHAVATASTTVIAAAESSPATALQSIDFGDQAAPEDGYTFGTPYTVTLVNTSSATQTLGTATVVGADSAAFTISADTCSSASLAAAGTCTLTLTANPPTVGVVVGGTLAVPVTSASGTEVDVALTATGSNDLPVDVEPGPGKVVVTWSTLPTINGETLREFAIERGTSPTNVATVATIAVGQPQTFTDPTVTPGVEYYYAVEPVPTNGGLQVTNPPVAAIPWDVGGAGTYVSIGSSRFLDTRRTTGGHLGRVTPSSPVRLPITGQAGIPTNVSAVVLNLTGVNATAGLNLTVWPDGKPRPVVSDLNLTRGQTQANLVTVPVGADGAIDISNSLGAVDVVVDVVGYYFSAQSSPPSTQSGQYLAADTAYRVEDTRAPGEGALPGGFDDDIPVGDFGADVSHVRAVVVNITATGSTGMGYLTAWDGIGLHPASTSMLNYAPGQTIANMAVVPVTTCDQLISGCPSTYPAIGIFNSGPRPVQVVVDVLGFIDDNTLQGGTTYRPLSTPERIVDTRSGTGALAPGSHQTAVVSSAGTADDLTWALDTNLTAVRPTANTYLTLWPYGYSGLTEPSTSNLNVLKGGVVANHAIAEVGPDNRLNVTNYAGRTDFLIDVSGTFELRNFPGALGTLENPASSARTAAVSRSAEIARSRNPLSIPPKVTPRRHLD